ncbi:MAG: peroxiredoxin 2/4 [Candidatus Cloacimonadota bacterium]|jgi:peroxiredoxin (alkyl hydroperoxide reductase subunit C)|nr:peroxiredoxin 2/4 [Candidatus Cloacimonadota bacterium]
MEQQGMPLLGDRLPELNVLTTHGPMTLPHDMAGKWFVLFSHPADFTPVCTTEFVAFQTLYEEFKKVNCELIGLSVDQVFSHIKWGEWIKDNFGVEIQFPIIADTGSVANRLGLIHPGKGTNTVRAVFIVDDKGTIRIIFYYPQELGRNMQEILRAVKGMQYSDANQCSMPADWPNNGIIKDHVIVSPPKDVKGAEERKAQAKSGDMECYDWWFCHRKG